MNENNVDNNELIREYEQKIDFYQNQMLESEQKMKNKDKKIKKRKKMILKLENEQKLLLDDFDIKINRI